MPLREMPNGLPITRAQRREGTAKRRPVSTCYAAFE